MRKNITKKSLTVLAIVSLVVIMAFSFQTVKAYAYNVNIDAYDNTEGTADSVHIYADLVDQGAAPVSVGYDSTVTITADATDSYSNPFKGWLWNGQLWIAESLALDPNANGYSFTAIYEASYVPPSGGGGTVTPPTGGGTNPPTPSGPGSYGSANGNYTFYGLNSETTGIVSGDVWVTAFYNVAGRVPEMFFVNGTLGYYNYSTSIVPMYFQYDLGYGDIRQYWPQPLETSGTFYILNATLTTYTINFLDYVGELKTHAYVSAQTYINGSLATIEKVKVDSSNTVLMHLTTGQKYYLILSGDGQTAYNYGDLLMTATTGVQLVLRGMAFSSQVLQLYQYVHAYSIRDFLNPTGAITVSYEDTLSQTTSVTVTITDAVTGSISLSQIFTSQNFSYTWTGVDNATDYEVTTHIDHQYLGNFDYKQFLPKEGAPKTYPFNLAFLGTSTGISTAVLIPALLIIFVAACFSELTAETAAILTCIVAILLTALGFIDIGQGAIISALSLSVLAAVVTARKKMQYS